MLAILKEYLISILFLTGTIICGVLYNLNGQYIDQDGFLHEAFGFIPLAWLFLLLAIISFITITIVKFVRKKKQ